MVGFWLAEGAGGAKLDRNLKCIRFVEDDKNVGFCTLYEEHLQEQIRVINSSCLFRWI